MSERKEWLELVGQRRWEMHLETEMGEIRSWSSLKGVKWVSYIENKTKLKDFRENDRTELSVCSSFSMVWRKV